MGTQKKPIFCTAQARALVFFDISRYLRDKCFDLVWGCHPQANPHMDPPKINSHYLICVGRSEGLFLSKLPSSFHKRF